MFFFKENQDWSILREMFHVIIILDRDSKWMGPVTVMTAVQYFVGNESLENQAYLNY